MSVYDIGGNELLDDILNLPETTSVDKSSCMELASPTNRERLNFYDYVGRGTPERHWKISFSNIYLSDATGSDSNDGLSSSTPLKTLDKAFDTGLLTGNEFRIHIISNGDYTLSGRSVESVCIHIVCEGDATNPTITFGQMAFYNCHINFRGMDASNKMTILCTDNTNGWYTDNSFSILSCLDINSVYKHNGGACHFENCTIHDIKINYADTRLYGVSCGDTLGRIDAIYLQQGGTCSVENGISGVATVSCSKMLDLQGVFATIRSAASGDLTKFTTGINANASFVLGSALYINSFGTTEVSNGGCILDGKTFIKP